jgi:hypothetical protein
MQVPARYINLNKKVKRGKYRTYAGMSFVKINIMEINIVVSFDVENAVNFYYFENR